MIFYPLPQAKGKRIRAQGTEREKERNKKKREKRGHSIHKDTYKYFPPAWIFPAQESVSLSRINPAFSSASTDCATAWKGVGLALT